MHHLDTFAQPLLAVNAQGRLMHTNASGERELQLAHSLSLQAQHVRAAHASDHNALLQAIDKALQGKQSLVRLRAHANHPITDIFVLVSPLTGSEPLVALQLERPSLCDPTVLALVAQSYELTPAEQRVLALLCEGQEITAIAISLRVAVSTIRSHVLAIRTKTAVNSIQQLVQRMARLPQMGKD